MSGGTGFWRSDSDQQSVDIPVLRTERLRLRSWEHPDVDALHCLYAHPDVQRNFVNPDASPPTLEEIRRNWSKHGFGSWVVAHRRTGRFIGMVSLSQLGHQPSPEIVWVLDPRFWNQGFATEAAAVVLRYAFTRLPLEQVATTCLAHNAASIRVVEKLGMLRVVSTDNADVDNVWTYLLTRQEWTAQNELAEAPLR